MSWQKQNKKKNWFIDPFPPGQIEGLHLGVISKGQTGKWRLITDLLFPEGQSMNDRIDSEFCSLNYTLHWLWHWSKGKRYVPPWPWLILRPLIGSSQSTPSSPMDRQGVCGPSVSFWPAISTQNCQHHCRCLGEEPATRGCDHLQALLKIISL